MPFVCGQYCLSAPRPYALYPYSILAISQGSGDHCHSAGDMGRPTSRSSTKENLSSPSAWVRSPTFENRRGLQAPFDMDTLKAMIQAARPDCGEVRKAILSCTFKPRERAFTRLINMCGRQKESRKATEVFATMRECRGLRPNTYTYSALISACSNSGDWDSAVDVFHRMKQAAVSDPGCRPNQVRACSYTRSSFSNLLILLGDIQRHHCCQ